MTQGSFFSRRSRRVRKALRHKRYMVLRKRFGLSPEEALRMAKEMEK